MRHLQVLMRNPRRPTTWLCCGRLDADIEFLETDIVDETIHALQHHPIVQMFQTCVDLGPKGEVMKVHTSFGWKHKTAQPFSLPRGEYPGEGFAHP